MTTVSGIVRDTQGNPVPNGQVSIFYSKPIVGFDGGAAVRNIRLFTADANGFVEMQNLVPGDYSVTISVPPTSDTSIGQVLERTTGRALNQDEQSFQSFVNSDIGEITPSVLQQAIDARDAAQAYAESPTPPDPDDAASKSAKTWALQAAAAAATVAGEAGKDYASRAAFVADTAYVSGANVPPDGTIVSAGGVQYVRSTGATVLPGLPGWLPFGNVVTPEHCGSVGDGVFDDTAGVQFAMAYADAANIFCDLQDGRLYRCTEKLTLAKRVKGRSTLDYSGVSSGFGRCAEIAGAKTTIESALTANAAIADFSAQVSDGTLFAAGDRVMIQSEALYPGLAGVNVKKGEIMRVQSVVGNTLRFDTSIHEPYLTADTAKVVLLDMVKGIDHREFTLRGPAIEGWGIQGICYDWCEDISIDDTRSEDCDVYAMPFQSCVHVRIKGTRTNTVRYTGVGSIFYGIVLLNACKDVRIESAYATKVRHHITTTATQTQHGEPLYVKAINCHADDMMAGDIYASYAYENHGYGRFIKFIACDVDGAFGLGKCEGSDTEYLNCTGRNLSVTGVRIPSTAVRVENVNIEGNKFSRATAGKASGSTVALDMPLAGAGRKRRNIVWKGNEISGWATTDGLADNAADIRGRAGDCTDIFVIGNRFIADPAQRSGDYAIYIDCPGAVVEENKILGNWPRGAYYLSDNVKSRRNIFRRDTLASAIAIRCAGPNIDSLDDEFENYSIAASQPGVATNARLRGGTFTNVTTRIAGFQSWCQNGLSLSGEFAQGLPNLQILDGILPVPTGPGLIAVKMDTEALAATDDLDTISAEPIGRVKTLYIVSTARVITVKHATGNLRLAGGADFTMNVSRATIGLISIGSEWVEQFRSVA